MEFGPVQKTAHGAMASSLARSCAKLSIKHASASKDLCCVSKKSKVIKQLLTFWKHNTKQSESDKIF